MSQPHIVLIAGPNGAGKSTAAPFLQRDYLGLREFVNADTIATGLAAFAPETVAVEAGRIMLRRLKGLADAQASFAFETTLASRTFAPWLRELREAGYLFHLYYLWVPTPDLSVSRVATRVLEGGHSVPEEDIRRRYTRSLQNLFRLYLPLADRWEILDNSQPTGCVPIARFEYLSQPEVLESSLWHMLEQGNR